MTREDRDRLYTIACGLPPSSERTEIIEIVVRAERQEHLAAGIESAERGDES